MRTIRVLTVLAATGGLALSACAQTASSGDADNFPSKSLRLVVPFPAGSATDVGTRVIGDCAEKELGQSLVIENVDGGDGLLGMREVAQAPNDGYTVAAASTSTLLVAPHFVQDAGYKTDSFDVIGAYTVSPLLLAVGKDSAIKSVDDMLASSKPLTVVTPGEKTSGGLAITALDQGSPAKLNQVPMASEPDAIRGLGAGDYDVAVFAMSPSVMESLKDRLRPLALTGEFSALSDVPTLADLGHGEDVPIPQIIGSWVVPSGTPDSAHDALAEALETCTTSDAIREKLGAAIPEKFVDGASVESSNEESATKLEALDQ